MFLTNKNDLLYDSKNFEKYNNIYCVLLNQKKIKYNEEVIGSNDHKLQHDYIEVEENLKLFFIIEQLSLAGCYKIIFGHYYNKSNNFLYKNVKNSKVISYSVKRCNNKELLYKNNKLVCANSYESLKRQIDYIDLTESKKIDDFKNPLEIIYDSNKKLLSINSNGIINISFENGCLNINNK